MPCTWVRRGAVHPTEAIQSGRDYTSRLSLSPGRPGRTFYEYDPGK